MRAMAFAAAMLVAGCAGFEAAPREGAMDATREPIVIAHRGASGERPEHTLMAYALAIAEGADFIEPDLVMTKDGVLVARHENEISGTTDVASRPEFAARKRTQTIDGESVTGWFTEDFTLKELKTLKARERLPELRPGNTRYDGLETVPTLEEILELIADAEAKTGRRVGVYPETKHPTHFAQIGLAMERPLVAALSRHGFDGPDDPVFIQSFEVGNLEELDRLTEVRLVQLVAAEGGPADRPDLTYAAMIGEAGLAAIARYADGIGAHKDLIIPRDGEGRLTAPSGLVARARAAGLLVHAWTFRAENFFLPADKRSAPLSPATAATHGDLTGELKAFYAAGVDGVFSDYPQAAVEAR